MSILFEQTLLKMVNIMNTTIKTFNKELEITGNNHCYFSKNMKLVRQKVFLDEILNILTKKPNG